MSVNCYPTIGKKKALKICTEFAAGCGGRVMPAGHPVLEPGAAFFYGWTDHTVPLMRRCQAEGRAWYYADNAYYIGRGKFFRVTKNALMHGGVGRPDHARLEAFNVRFADWQRGRHVIVATQSEGFYRERLGITRDAWTAAVVAELRRHTAREIVVCHKPAAAAMRPEQPHAPNLESLLAGAWALVTHSSSAGVAALIAGVPVFSTEPGMFAETGLRDLARIETPHYPDNRAEWLAVLAGQQWTYDELRDGTCWRALNA